MTDRPPPRNVLDRTVDNVGGAFSVLWNLLGGLDRVPGCTLGRGSCPPHIECDNCNPKKAMVVEVIDTVGKVLK